VEESGGGGQERKKTQRNEDGHGRGSYKRLEEPGLGVRKKKQDARERWRKLLEAKDLENMGGKNKKGWGGRAKRGWGPSRKMQTVNKHPQGYILSLGGKTKRKANWVRIQGNRGEEPQQLKSRRKVRPTVQSSK